MGFLTETSYTILSNEQLQRAVGLRLFKTTDQGSKLSKLDLDSGDGKLLCHLLAFHLLCLRWAITAVEHKQAGSDQPSSHQEFWGLIPKSYSELEHLCRLLYFGPPVLKILASSCMVEAFYGMAESKRLEGQDSRDEQKSLFSLQSIVMVLQGSLFNSNAMVQKNSSSCLYSLISNDKLSASERAAVLVSPWYRFVVEELVLGLSTPETSQPVPNSIYVAIGLLRLSSPPSWMSPVFRPCISTIVASLTCGTVTSSTVALLKELQDKKYVNTAHMEAICRILQASRKMIYEKTCVPEGTRKIDGCDESLQSCEHILMVAVSSWLDPLTGFRGWQLPNGDCPDSDDPQNLVTQIDHLLSSFLETPVNL